MAKPKYSATHVFFREPDKNGWVKMAYLTKMEDNTYRSGLKGRRVIFRELVERWMQNIGLIELDNPFEIDEEKGFWLTPNNEIYLASDENPQEDKNKTLIQKLG